MRVMLVGNRGGTHIGGSFERAARMFGWDVRLYESDRAMRAPRWLRAAKWHLMGRTPPRLDQFSEEVVTECRKWMPDLLVTTGCAPLTFRALEMMGQMNVVRCNYLTDDPWNKAHRARWFLKALGGYDHVLTPRRSNLQDLRNMTDATVQYLPFGYDQDLFYLEELSADQRQRYETDIVFIGGADRDRVPYVVALSNAGLRVTLYGSYWDKVAETRHLTRGQATPEVIRKALTAARITLCLVRRANRDGHCMRTFEGPAAGACMLVEDTPEHRELLGFEGECVTYFSSIPSLVEHARSLAEDATRRARLSAAAYLRVTNGRHRYCDRLKQMIMMTRLRTGEQEI